MFCRAIRSWLIVVLLVPASSFAGTIYVSNVIGNDRANGLFPEIGGGDNGPVATIGRALKIVQGTDAIVIANTGLPYVESVTFDRPDLQGTVRYPIVIEGNGATLRGAQRLSPDLWRRVGEGTYRFQPFRKGHYQLAVNGTPATEVRADEIAASPPRLEPLQWCAWHGHVYFRVEPTKFIDQYELEAPLFDVGLGLHNARNVVVRNLKFELFRLDGIAVTGNSRNVQILNVRSTANGRAGLSVSGTSQVTVGGLEMAGNRIAEQLTLLKGRISGLPETDVPAKPAPQAWDLKSNRYVRIVTPRPDQPPTSTAGKPAPTRR